MLCRYACSERKILSSRYCLLCVWACELQLQLPPQCSAIVLDLVR